MALIQGQKRLSIRAVALRYGIPSRVVARAVWLGELNAIKTTTETGQPSQPANNEEKKP